MLHPWFVILAAVGLPEVGTPHASPVAPAGSPHAAAYAANRDRPTFPPEAVVFPRGGSRPRDPDGVVMGYLPYWESPSALPWDVLDILAWFSVELETDGTLSTDHGWLGSSADQLRAAAAAAGADVVLCATLFGGAALEAFFADPDAVDLAIDGLVQRVIDGDGDGLDLDLEGLRVGNREDLVDFVVAVRAALDAVRPGMLLTLATPAVDWSDAYDYGALAAVADHLFVMGYAFSGDWSDPGPNAPLDGGSLWGSRDLTWSAQDYAALVDPADLPRVLMGLPLYGNTWWVAGDSMPATATDDDATSNFFGATRALAAAEGASWEPTSASWYTNWNAGTGWQQAWYEDEASLALKIEMARAEGLGGFGFWALGYDDGDATLWAEMAAQAAAWDPADPGDDDTSDDDDASDDDAADDDAADDDAADDDAADDDLADDDMADDDSTAGEDQAPEIRIEAPAQAQVGERVVLDGSGSMDPEGAALTFVWSQSGGPDASLWGARTAAPSFAPDVDGAYTFSVEVSDGTTAATGSVEVEVLADGRGCGGGGAAAWLLLPIPLRRRPVRRR